MDLICTRCYSRQGQPGPCVACGCPELVPTASPRGVQLYTAAVQAQQPPAPQPPPAGGFNPGRDPVHALGCFVVLLLLAGVVAYIVLASG